jgi:hypothetical protein
LGALSSGRCSSSIVNAVAEKCNTAASERAGRGRVARGYEKNRTLSAFVMRPTSVTRLSSELLPPSASPTR